MKYIKLCFRLLLGLFMTYAGISHLTIARQEFVAQVPTWLQFSPGFTDFVVLASGVVEIALGLGMLFLWKKKALVGALLALFYVLIFPGNINQYVNHIDAFGLNTIRPVSSDCSSSRYSSSSPFGQQVAGSIARNSVTAAGKDNFEWA